MDIEKCIAQNAKLNDEEINKLMAPETQNMVERYIYLLKNGQQFQKVFVAKNLKQCVSMEFCIVDLLQAICDIIINTEEMVQRELMLGLSELLPLIKIRQPQFSKLFDIATVLFLKNQRNLIKASGQLLQLDIVNQDLSQIIEVVYLETDDQMYLILNIVKVFYKKMGDTHKFQCRIQMKAAAKHKDEQVRKFLLSVLKNNQILQDMMKDYDWLDSFSYLFYDQSKVIRKKAMKILILMIYNLKDDIYKPRLEMLFSNSIQQLEISEYGILDKIFEIVGTQSQLQEQIMAKLLLFQVDAESSILFLENYPKFIKPFELFDLQHQTTLQERFLLIIGFLSDNSQNMQFIQLLIPIFELISMDLHLKILNQLFSNFEFNQAQYIPYINELIQKSMRLKTHKGWIVQLQKVYDGYKKQIQYLESRGLWSDINKVIDILQTVHPLIQMQRDFQQLCQKLTQISSYQIRKKATQLLVEMIPNLDSHEQRDYLVDFYFQNQNSPNYKNRQLLIEFTNIVAKNRSRKFFQSFNFQSVLQLSSDPIPQVRYKMPELIFHIRLLFWNEEKELTMKLIQMHQQLMNDKKQFVSTIAKEFWDKICLVNFSKTEHIHTQLQINIGREALEQANFRSQSSQSQRQHTKPDNKIRNQTPTQAKPPQKPRQNGMLQVPSQYKQTKGRSQQRPPHSKSPHPVKYK